MYKAEKQRYKDMKYNFVGESGLLLPALSLGLWHNFGSEAKEENMKDMLFTAFDLGITHFDIANNYGPIPGSAESNFGKILKSDMLSYRDEMIISSKAGYTMWKGPYGDFGSKKYLVASMDQSLIRTKLNYFDIFYHHRMDFNTPLEETAYALDLMVKQGKALYIGISNYNAIQTHRISKIFKELKTPFIINQVRYNMLDRHIEGDDTNAMLDNQIGAIAFSPLAQGLLSDRYIKGIPADSRASLNQFLSPETIKDLESKVSELRKIAIDRGQTLVQMAVAWILQNAAMASVLIGASKKEQIIECQGALKNLDFNAEELNKINEICL